MKKLTALITLVLATMTVSCGGSSTNSSEESSVSQSKFCSAFTEMSSAIEKLGEETSPTDTALSDEESEAQIQEIIDGLAATMISEAPESIKAEAKIMSEYLVEFTDLFSKVEYDEMGNPSDPALAARLEELNSNPDTLAAGETLDAYLQNECEIDINGTSTSGGDFCDRLNGYTTALMATGFGYDPEVPDSFKQVYTSVVSAAESMLEVAPEEMRDPAQVLVDKAKDLLDYLEGIDFDADRAGEDPKFQSLDNNDERSSALGDIQMHCVNAAENG